jgi:hypothetical protein
MNFTTNKTSKARMILRPYWGILLVILILLFASLYTGFELLVWLLPFVIPVILSILYSYFDARWLKRLIMTILIGLCFLIVHSLLICGCHFHWVAVPFLIVPISWAIYANCTCRDQKERIVGYVAIVMALLSFLFGFMSNLIFLVD